VTFVVGLSKIDNGAGCSCPVIQHTGDIVQRIMAVYLWFTCTQQVEIGPVQYKNNRLVSQCLSPDYIKAAVADRGFRALYAPQ